MSKPAYGSTLNTGATLSANLVALYLLNETSGTVVHDLTANALNSTSSAGLDWSTNPTELTLDGSTTYADMGTSSLLAVASTDRSFEVMFRQTARANGVTPKLMQRMVYGPYQGFEIGILPPDDASNPNKLYYGTSNFGGLYTVIGPTIALNTDYHVVVTQAMSQITVIYLDGVSVASGTPVNPGTISPQHFELGRSNDGTGYFHGLLNKAAVYNAVLTAANVSSLYSDPWQQVTGIGTAYTGTLAVSVAPAIAFTGLQTFAGTLAVSVAPTIGMNGAQGYLGTLAVSVAPDVGFVAGGDPYFAVYPLPEIQFGSGALTAAGTLAVSVSPNVRFEGSTRVTGTLAVSVSPDVLFAAGFGVHGHCFVSDGAGYPPAVEAGLPLGNYVL